MFHLEPLKVTFVVHDPYQSRDDRLGDFGASAIITLIGVLVTAAATTYTIVKDVQSRKEVTRKRKQIEALNKETAKNIAEAREIESQLLAGKKAETKSTITNTLLAAGIGTGALFLAIR